MTYGRKPQWTEQQLWDAVRYATSQTERLTTVAYEALRRPDDPSIATLQTRLVRGTLLNATPLVVI